jgi:hypothetical protein
MEDESKGMKALYTLFLISVTIHTIVLLADRFAPKPECSCKEKDKVKG